MAADPASARLPGVVPMMLPPDRRGRDDAAWALYDAHRGTCPSCGSGEVTHLVVGMPSSDVAWGSGPDWIRWVGCVHLGWDRECATCRLRWSVDRDAEPRGLQEDR